MHESKIDWISTYPSIVGGVLSHLRTQQGLNQVDMAQAVGVAQTTWSRVETGQSSVTIEHLKLAADRLGIKPSEILYHADETVLDIQMRGVEVSARRQMSNGEKAAFILGGAALTALIVYAISKSRQ